jgi:hypothetical protein
MSLATKRSVCRRGVRSAAAQRFCLMLRSIAFICWPITVITAVS